MRRGELENMGHHEAPCGIRSQAISSQGRIPIEGGYELAYRVYGVGERTLLALHGGPGVSSNYLSRLAEVASGGLQVVLYDQLGGGDSDRPADDSLWQVPRFISEVEQVRSHLDLGDVTLFGQSWGGMLALAYTLDHPEAVTALVLSNTFANGKDYLVELFKHRMNLGSELHALMLRREYENNLAAPDYLDAVLELNSRHLRRSSPYEPARSRQEYLEAEREYDLADVGPAYALWGPHEFLGTGPEAYFDISHRLGEISVPALILCGWYDELTPEACSRPLASGIRDNEYVVFGNASHLTILEKESDLYLACIRNFLERRLGLSRRS
jgi:proline-specific peptidase